MARVLALLGTIILLAGCASEPTFVGKWQAVSMPSSVPPGATAMTADINNDDSFSLILTDPQQKSVYTMSGSWQLVSPREASIVIEHGSRRPGGDRAVARLNDDGQMVIDRLDDEITFERMAPDG